MNQPRIYLSPPHLSGREQQYFQEALAGNWLSSAGPQIERFEQLFAERIGVEHALAVSSGTAALHLALRHLNVGSDDEVICPTLTFCASANPIVYLGATPVFLDSEAASWNLDPNLLEDELRDAAQRGKLPKAIVAVDLFGQSADMDAIVSAAARYEIPVIEDAAEALGATYQGRATGSIARASFFSFNGNKIITASGGGMLCSNDSKLIENAHHLATQARDPVPYYQHSTIGYNYQMSNLLAAVGTAQLEALSRRVATRRQIFQYYRQYLRRLPGVSLMPQAPFGRGSRWLTVITIEPEHFGFTCEELRQRLEAHNIESRRVWKPLHQQPVFAGCRYRGGQLAERLFQTGLCLPSGSSMTMLDLQRVIRAVQSAAGNTASHRRAA